MKSVSRKDFIAAGSVARTHGNNGEIRLTLNTEVQFEKWAFLELKGKPVPFYIERAAGADEAPILKLKDVDDPVKAALLVGSDVLIPASRQAGSAGAGGADVYQVTERHIGWLLFDSAAGKIGEVLAVARMPHQVMLQTLYRDRETLIPVTDEFIVSTDENKKVIYLDLPEGLLDLE